MSDEINILAENNIIKVVDNKTIIVAAQPIALVSTGNTGPRGPKGPKGLNYTGNYTGTLLNNNNQYNAPIPFNAGYNNGNGYMTDDVIYFDGSSYVCLEDHTDENPTDAPTKWGLLASKGETGSSVSGYNFVQPTPNTLWNINHNLGYNPSVTAFNSGNLEVECSIVHISNNQTQLLFLIPISGYARVI